MHGNACIEQWAYPSAQFLNILQQGGKELDNESCASAHL